MKYLYGLRTIHITIAIVLSLAISWYFYFSSFIEEARFWMSFSIFLVVLYFIINLESEKNRAFHESIRRQINKLDKEKRDNDDEKN